MLSWLTGPDLEASDGHCLSWSNPAGTGYSYPEISGLLLHLLSRSETAIGRREQLRRALIGERAKGTAIRRGGQSYTFDTAMVVGGMLAHAQAGLHVSPGGGPAGSPAGQADGAELDGAELDDAVRGWVTVLIGAVGHRNPFAEDTGPGQLTASTSWSRAFGAHQAKVCGALLDAERLLSPLPDLCEAVAACAAAALDVLGDDGRFRIHAASPMTYVHSHCYAVEGLLMLAAAGARGVSEEAAAGAEWLAAAQQPEGGLRAWHDGSTASGPPRADATAQAIRIWTLVDRGRFADETARAWAFLAGLQAPAAGLRYEAGSADVNAWATIFAVQALSWSADPLAADAARLV
jgi:hypothetical protein